MTERYLNRELAKEIGSRISNLEELDQHRVASICHRKVKKNIEKNAQIHSFRIENPSLEVPFSVPRNNKGKKIKKGIENIKNASEWAAENFYPEILEESFIREIAGKITPELYIGPVAEYRKDRVRITNASVTPPDAHKVRTLEIPYFIESLREQLECEKPINRVESAIYAHLHIARIHPFIDGNGRTARVLQDTILSHYGIPVPVIEVGERMTYYDLLDGAVYDWKHNGGKEKGRVTPGEKRFYEYIGGKVNVSLDHILQKCSNNS